MKMKKTQKWKKIMRSKKFLTSCLLIVISLCLPAFSMTVLADSDYYSRLSDDEIEELFSLEIGDIPDPFSWILDTNTYIIFERTDSGNITYWWNAPNLQQTFQNILFDSVTVSGYGSGRGRKAYEDQDIVPIPEDGVTALEQYGFHIPCPAYVGERPMVTISILGVLLPDNVFDGAGRAWDFFWSGTIVDLPTSEDLNSLTYASPHDYETGGATFMNWVRENWDAAMSNIDSGQILLSNADEDGMRDNKRWLKADIIEQHGLDQTCLDAEYICQQLEVLCGVYYGDVAKNIMLTSGINEVHHVERIMPYDLSRMNSQDKDLFDGIGDPRSDMQASAASTGYDKIITNSLKVKTLEWSGSLSQYAVQLNTIGSFAIFESTGVDPMILWSNGILQFLLTVMGVIFVIFCVKSAFKVFSGSYSVWTIVSKVSCTFLVVVMILSLSLSPQNVYDGIKTVSTTIFDFGNIALTQNDKIAQLYGNGDALQKENVNLWLPYFGSWTKYNTGHGLLDKEQLIDGGNVGPENDGLKDVYIDGVKQNLWSCVLADNFTSGEPYTGEVYRVVDHFMAPRFDVTSVENVEFSVQQNENYDGNIQSKWVIDALFGQILILCMVFLKAIFFWEFIVQLMLLFVNLSLSVMEKNKTIRVLKELGASALCVMVCNMVVTLFVYMILSIDGVVSIFVYPFMGYIVLKSVHYLMMSQSIYSPKILSAAYHWLRRLTS